MRLGRHRAALRRRLSSLSRAGLLEWEFIAVQVPLPLEFLFDPSVDVAEPYDRTLAGAGSAAS